jgi:hypothetical protein
MNSAKLFLHTEQVEQLRSLIDQMYRRDVPQCLAAQVFIISPACAELRVKYYSHLSAWVIYAAMKLARWIERLA